MAASYLIRTTLKYLSGFWISATICFNIISLAPYAYSPTSIDPTHSHITNVLSPQFNLSLLILCLSSWFLRVLFLCAFFHRFFSHHSYCLGPSCSSPASSSCTDNVLRKSETRSQEEACACSDSLPHRFLCFVFACLGSLALDGGPISWKEQHLQQHRKHDTNNAANEEEAWQTKWQRWPEILVIEKLNWLPFLIFALCIRCFFWDVHGSGLFWGICIPTVLSSIVNRWIKSDFDGSVVGGRNYRTDDASCNNFVKSLLTLGEGYNNNHHSNLGNPRFGFSLSEPDFVYLFLYILQRLHLIHFRGSSPSNVERYNFDGNRIYVGKVTHTRESPVKHQFTYDIYMMYVELNDDTPYAFDEFFLWSSGKRDWKQGVIARLDSSRYLSRAGVQDMVKKETGMEADGRIFLLTHFAYMGYSFNPISLYYCFKKEGQLLCMISEVTNIPWGEKCYYISLPNVAEENETSTRTVKIYQDVLTHKKKMHVSPFFSMDYTYVARFNTPGKELHLSWALEKKVDSEHEERVQQFKAWMVLESRPVTQMNLLKQLLSFPMMTWKVVFAIHWQALVLWWKGVPVITHPKYAT